MLMHGFRLPGHYKIQHPFAKLESHCSDGRFDFVQGRPRRRPLRAIQAVSKNFGLTLKQEPARLQFARGDCRKNHPWLRKRDASIHSP
jgi:hypothetical protein